MRGLIACALALAACTSEFMTVEVDGVPEGVTRLVAHVTLDDAPAREAEVFEGERFDPATAFVLQLGHGTRGRLAVVVEAHAEGCVVAWGGGDARVTGGRGSLYVALTPIAPDCSGAFRRTPGMVTIPAGPFIMGCGFDECYDDEKPERVVTLRAYEIDRYEVSRAAYDACVREGACPAPLGLQAAGEAAAYLTWDGASAYCAFRGKRLPTEAEWEKAARGEDGRVFPWGNVLPDCGLANYSPDVGVFCVDGEDVVLAPGSTEGASPYGLFDTSGNLQEWVADWYQSSYAGLPDTDPTGPATGIQRVLRGGSWAHFPFSIRTTSRHANAPDASPPATSGLTRELNAWTMGVRCAKDL